MVLFRKLRRGSFHGDMDMDTQKALLLCNNMYYETSVHSSEHRFPSITQAYFKEVSPVNPWFIAKGCNAPW